MQWGVSTTSFPISVSAVYSIIAAKKDTSANSVPDVQNYSSTGFAYYGPSPYAWFAVCKAQQWGVGAPYSDGYSVTTLPIPFSNTDYTVIANSSWLNSGAVMASAALSVTQIKVRNGGYTDTYHFLTIGRQQWGTYEIAKLSTELITITFPVSFAATAYSVTLGHKGPSNWTNGANVNYVNKTVSDMTVYYCDGYGFSWLAIGMQQWGYNNTDYAASVTFPIAFTKSCYAIAIGPHNRVTGNVVAQNITNSKFSLTAPESGDCAQARWIAIGVQRSGDIQRHTMM